MTEELKGLSVEEKLVKALEDIIEQCPNPKLPYGINVVEIAREAIQAWNTRDNDK